MVKCRWCKRTIGLDMMGICGHCRRKILREAARSQRLREDLTFTAAAKPAKKGSV